MAQANKFADAFKSFSDFKAPNYDFNQFFTLNRRNLEAFTAANQAFAEGAQAVARRGAEIARNNTEETIQHIRDIYASGSPESGAQKSAEFAKEQFENTLANAREMFEMLSKSNMEAAEIVTKRLSETLNEAGKTAKKNS